MADILNTLKQLLLPKSKPVVGGTALTTTFRPNAQRIIAPAYHEHLADLFADRVSLTSHVLMNTLVTHDPDVSAAVHAYLTTAGSSELRIEAYGLDGTLDPAGIQLAWGLLGAMTEDTDYTKGFSLKPSLDSLINNIRYMFLLRGACACELVLDKLYTPTEFRLIDPITIVWSEVTNGVFTAVQRPTGVGIIVDLNIPTFFSVRHHQNPIGIYSYSMFVSAINTIASRQLVMRELYSIMRVTGFPRMDIQVLEEVLMKHAPKNLLNDFDKTRNFVDGELAKIKGTINNLQSNQAFVHSDAVSATILNEGGGAASLQISEVIGVLDAQNQAALKTMPSVVGRGTNGQTASTEARLFAMSSDSLNRSVGSLLTKVLTLSARLAGYQGKIIARFPPVELRPSLDAEPGMVMRRSRLEQDLSLGVISDAEYTMELYNRVPLPNAPVLQGTNFAQKAGPASVDVANISPNSDPLGRSLAPPGGKSAKSNGVAPAKP